MGGGVVAFSFGKCIAAPMGLVGRASHGKQHWPKPISFQRDNHVA